MKISELITALRKYPKDAEVFYFCPDAFDIPVKYLELTRVKETSEKTGITREKTIVIIS